MPVDASSLPVLRPSALRALRSRLQLVIRDAGQADLSPEAAHPHAPYWQLEPHPLILASDEWRTLENAALQRARLINALLADVYNEQAALRAGVLPPELILGDPYYRRPCLRLEPARVDPATVLRFDLARTTEGWVFTGTRANTPIGFSYAVQNRRFLSQEAGELYGALPEYRNIIDFPLQLLAALHALSPRTGGDASIVLLTAGPQDPFYSEHSFLARKMGLPLARGDDLLVLDNRVYFKTVAGLEPVDVIYRRLNDAHIDPVVFSTDRESVGVPGLLQCIRHGNVAIANAIGTGLAESRSLDAFLPALMPFYLGEKPLLPSLPTLACGDPDQLQQIIDAPDFQVRPAHDPRLGAPAPDLTPGPDGLPAALARNPHQFVAQKVPAFQPLDNGLAHPVGCTLSLYVLTQGRQHIAMPGGLVHLGAAGPPRDRVGHTADAIVLLDPATERDDSAHEVRPPGVPHNVLGSRAAENLFWLGRYIERAEITARMLSIVDDVALEETPGRDRHRWLPIWRGLFEAAGHPAEKASPSEHVQNALSIDQLWRLTLTSRHPSSLYSSIGIACENGRQLRDHVSPECWAILSRLHARLETLRRPDSAADGTTPLFASPELRRQNALASAEIVASEINAFIGTAERTLLHDASWHFMRIGRYLERALMTCSALRHPLGALDDEIRLRPDAPRNNPELSALLRMLGSQDAYRRIYQTTTRPRYVAALLLQHSDAPRSICHNLRSICGSLRAIRMRLPGADHSALDAATDIIHTLETLPLDRYFSGFDPQKPAPPLGQTLLTLLERLYSLHPLLSDHYFSHQAHIPAQAQLSL